MASSSSDVLSGGLPAFGPAPAPGLNVPGFVEDPQGNQHGSGAPAQAGGEAADVGGEVEATGEREERPRKVVKTCLVCS